MREVYRGIGKLESVPENEVSEIRDSWKTYTPSFSIGKDSKPVVNYNHVQINQEISSARQAVESAARTEGENTKEDRSRKENRFSFTKENEAGDGQETVVFLYGDKRVIKRVRGNGVYTILENNEYALQYDFDTVALKSKAINALNGLKTGVFEVNRELFYLQEKGIKITQVEYESINRPYTRSAHS